MFYIHQSNQVEMLADKLSEIIRSSVAPNPFTQEVILVQSPGMSQWLKISLAQRVSVMANIEFPLPSSFIWKLYQRLIDDLPEQSAFNKSDMTWKLYGILPGFLDLPSFKPLNHYLSEDTDGLMLYQLCEKVADVFDQYLMYRPDWIDTWERGEDEIKDGDISLHPWQSVLWRALKSHTETLGQSSFHRANLHEALLLKLQTQEGQQKAQLPHRLFIFGISALPRAQLHLIEQLALHMDIHLMLFNPCFHYWGDIVDEKQLARVQARFKGKRHLSEDGEQYLSVGNPLLASWGKLGRDYLEQLLEVDADQWDLFVEPTGNSALNIIQQDIFNLTFRQQMEPLEPYQSLTDFGKDKLPVGDASIVLHACHSPLREVEVLHDQLLHLFEQSPELTPKDVIVMMPDVSAYSPYIDAVFQGNGQYRIPYSISDRGFVLENPIINSFLQLMKLPQSRFCASELLDMIGVPATFSALGLAPNDIDLVHHWIEQVGIRWGIDSEHKRALDLPDDELNSWRFGLNRLLLGYAIGQEQLVDGILPYVEVEGQDAEVLGKLVGFMDILIEFRDRLAQDDTIEQKVQIVGELLERFYLPDADELQVLNQIREALVELKYHQDNGNCSGKINQTIFAYWLSHAFDEKGVGQRFLAGQVNFCTLMPMRSIPFKVICLLGMNDADYPRFVAPVGFDLMALGNSRKGDRSRRLDDRYLLLEALLSARQKLYISYIGRSMQDNSEKIPSVLVTELLEYCQERFMSDKPHQWVIEHPLQPFNPVYFSNDANLLSYQSHWFRFVDTQEPTIARDQSIEPIDNVETQNEIEVEQLLRFIEHPVRYFFNHTLQLYFSRVSGVELDDEAFHLDALGRYQLLEKLTFEKLKDSGLDNFHHVKATGHLPHRGVGQLAYDTLSAQADQFVQTLKQTNLRYVSPLEINLMVGDVRLLGWVKNLTDDGLLFYRPASVKAKDRLRAWLTHVIVSAAGIGVKTRHFGLSDAFYFKPIEQTRATELVSQWLTLYRQGRSEPLAFFAQSSEKWAKSGKLQEVAKAFDGNSFNKIPGERDDPYISQIYKDVSHLPESFEVLSEQLFCPLLDAEEVL